MTVYTSFMKIFNIHAQTLTAMLSQYISFPSTKILTLFSLPCLGSAISFFSDFTVLSGFRGRAAGWTASKSTPPVTVHLLSVGSLSVDSCRQRHTNSLTCYLWPFTFITTCLAEVTVRHCYQKNVKIIHAK